MVKLYWLDKQNYKLENITKTIAKVPTIQAHIILVLGVFFGGGTFLGAFLANVHNFNSDIERIPEYVLMMIVGWMAFSFCVPFAYIVYLFKEIQLLKDKLKDINKDELKTSASPI